MSLVRSISGLRATQGDDLTPAVISRYCAAFAKYLPPGAIVIARDARPSGLWMEYVAIGVFSSLGRETRILGAVPTPTAQIYAERDNEVAGCVVLTASHNPAQWNGMKFLGGNGIFLDADENHKFWSYLDAPTNLPIITAAQYPKIIADAIEKHIAGILSVIPDAIYKKTKDRKFSVVVDAVNAAGSIAMPNMLRRLGCKVETLYCDGSGIFPHTPEPLPEHLGALSAAVREHSADLGVAVDPDADRLVLVDEKGEAINEELTVALAALSLFKNGIAKGYAPICVVNYSTSRAVDAAIAEYGGKALRAPVGEINVVRAMQKHNAAIGGEGSGGVIYPACHYGRDSLAGAALILQLLVESGKSLSELVAAIPRYAMKKMKLSYKGDPVNLFSYLESEFAGAQIIREDGIYINFGESWLHARASNTEPIVRVIAESLNSGETDKLIERVLKITAELSK